MTMTPLLIVGLLAMPPAVNDEPRLENPQIAVHSIRPLLRPDAFRADSVKRLKVDFRPEAGAFTKRGVATDRAIKQAPSRAASQPQRRSLARTIVGAAVGAFGGFFLGGYAGAAIEGDCGCDDPGLRGFLIGAPIGAVAGGIIGSWISGR